MKLMGVCRSLIEQVADVQPREPEPRQLEAWFRRPLKDVTFREGLQAVEWTVDERGLAGLSDLQGLPWSMPMETFFEAWAETVLADVARQIGGVLKSGRKRQTVAPLHWNPPHIGSQKYLLPDVMLERGDTTIIVDAKYKEHWEEMRRLTWRELDDQIREQHRADLLQVLAYANLATTTRIVVCLAYPCTLTTWNSLNSRNRVFHRASLSAGERRVDLLLTAFPMSANVRDVSSLLAREVA